MTNTLTTAPLPPPLDRLLVADNANDSPEYLCRVRAPAAGRMSTSFAEDVELPMRIG